MTLDKQTDHDTQIITQFTKQAIPFLNLSGHHDSIQLLIEMSGVTQNDLVLDVACGPGIISCEFAKVAKHVTGIDLTEKMIEQAIKRQEVAGLNNLSWEIGSASELPYPDAVFSIVVTRYSFHHFLNPAAALAEMIRVCRLGGSILVADAALAEANVKAYNQMERLRDPSHVKALSYEEWQQLFNNAGLHNLRHASYKVPMSLEAQLKASFPYAGDEEKIRTIFVEDLTTNSLGGETHQINGEIHFNYPISVFKGEK